MRFNIHFLSFIILLFSACSPEQKEGAYRIMLSEDEKVWAGVIDDGYLMPFSENYEMDMYGNNKYNQLQPLILTSKGQYAWSEEPYKFSLSEKEITIYDPLKRVETGKFGTSLPEVQKFVREKYFSSSRKSPSGLFITSPQYNTWIELTYNQNQKDVLNYARSILETGLPAGIIMIDDTWQEDYGKWDFHPGRFPDPVAMVNELHSMGFRVMLWICPFVSADQTLIYNELKNKKAFLLEKKHENDTWESVNEPAMIRWWNGVSALLDFSNPLAVGWFNEQLKNLEQQYNIDGFKFDAGDMNFYPPEALSKENITPNEHCRLYAEIGLGYEFNEYRACWKMGGEPLVQRLGDKRHSWEDLQKLIPQMVLQNLMGYTYSCPDMVGGGLYTTFQDESRIDQELIVRSAQCHALMTMMQFSVAPWRILDEKHFSAVKKAVELRQDLLPVIMRLVERSTETGEPIIQNLEYAFPGQGYEDIIDQFMLGDRILVAPVVEKGKFQREVILPPGEWTDEKGIVIPGNQKITIEAPLERLPYFTLNQQL